MPTINPHFADAEQGLREMAQRMQNAAEGFVAMLTEPHYGLTRQQAEHVFALYQEMRLIKRDAVNATYRVKHGLYLEPNMLARAALTRT
jgi:hypothetical protein